jgi:hypothetical protein
VLPVLEVLDDFAGRKRVNSWRRARRIWEVGEDDGDGKLDLCAVDGGSTKGDGLGDGFAWKSSVRMCEREMIRRGTL